MILVFNKVDKASPETVKEHRGRTKPRPLRRTLDDRIRGQEDQPKRATRPDRVEDQGPERTSLLDPSFTIRDARAREEPEEVVGDPDTEDETKTRAEEAISRVLPAPARGLDPQRSGDPFKTLIRTILSQNTNWRNEDTAYRRLEETDRRHPPKSRQRHYRRSPRRSSPLACTTLGARSSNKSQSEVIERFNGDLTTIVSKPYPEARETLMTLPGVGEKTADVVLLFNAGKRVIPVDRHIARIAKRLELVPENAPYDTIRSTLEEATSPKTLPRHTHQTHTIRKRHMQGAEPQMRQMHPKRHLPISPTRGHRTIPKQQTTPNQALKTKNRPNRRLSANIRII